MTDLLDAVPDDTAVSILAGQSDITATDLTCQPDPLPVDLTCGHGDIGTSADGLIVIDGPAVPVEATPVAITRLAVGQIYTHHIRYGPHAYPQQITTGNQEVSG